MIALALAALVQAAQRPEGRPDSLRRPAALGAVLTTATRESRPLAAVPGAIAVVDSAALRRTRGVHLAEALRLVPGLSAGSLYGSEDARVTIRGAGNRGGFGVRGVAILLDGIPLTEPDGQGRLDLPELAVTRQVEVVRGPSSALYGGAAGGGALQLVGTTGRDAPGAGFRSGFGGAGLAKLDATAGGASGAWDALVHGGTTRAQGYRRWSDGEVDRANLRLGHLVGGGRVALDVSASRLRQRIPGALMLAEWTADRAATEPVNLANRFERRETRWRAAARANGLATAGGTTDAWLVASGRDNEQAIFQFIRQGQRRWQAGVRHAHARVHGDVTWRVTLGLEGDRAAGPQTNWVNRGGAPVLATACVPDAPGGASVPCQRQDATLSSWAGAAQATFERGAWSLVGGVRYDAVRFDVANRIRPAQSVDRRFAQVSPKVALSWRPTPTVTWWLSLARGFEVPTAVELATSPDTARGFNDALGPSSQWQVEAGWRGAIGARLAGEVAAFAGDVRGDIVSRTVAIPGVPAPRAFFENAARSRRLGLEASATMALAPGWTLMVAQAWHALTYAAFTSQGTGPDFRPVARDVAGRRLPAVPAARTAAELAWAPSARWRLALVGERTGRIVVDHENTVAGALPVRTGSLAAPVVSGILVPFEAVRPHALCHVQAERRLRGATVQLMLDNALGSPGIAVVVPNASNGRFYLPGPGRTLSVGLSLGSLRP